MEENNEENFYEDLLNNRDLKGGKGSKIFVILLILIVLGLMGYVLYIKFFTKKEEVKNDVKKEEVIQEYSFNCEDSCSYPVKINGEDINILYETSVTDDDDTYNHKITISDNEILNKDFSCGGPATLKVLDDMIVISFHEGCDILGNYINIYDKNGNEIMNITKFDDYNMSIENTEFDIKDKKIIVKATRLYHGPTLRLNELEEVDVCDTLDWQNYGVNEETITNGTYEIEYLQDGIFAKAVLKEKNTLKDALNSCNNE